MYDWRAYNSNIIEVVNMKAQHILVRLPQDLKDWLKEQAISNASTLTAEVVRSIRDRMLVQSPVMDKIRQP